MTGAQPELELVLLAKPPVAGACKSRLVAPDGLTAAEAAALMAALLRDVLAELARGPWRLTVCHPAGETAALAELCPVGVTLTPEPLSNGFGALLAGLVAAACARGAGAVALVAGDVPGLTCDLVAEAFAALTRADLVVGPDQSGGCYLLATAGPLPLLADPRIVWQQGTDAGQLAHCADGAGLRVVRLRELVDLDRPSDLARWRAEGGTRGPAVAQWCARKWVG